MLHIALLSLLTLAMVGVVMSAAAEPYVDTITFLRVGDEAQALSAVQNGTLDMHYWSIPHHLLVEQEGIQIFEVPVGGVLSLLLNPAEGEQFNPLQLSPVRFAIHHLVDRERIVEDVLGGYGSPIVAPFPPYHPDYARTLSATESFVIRHDPDLAHSIIDKAMTAAGAVKEDGVWMHDGEPVRIIMFIRDDDLNRLNIGETLASALEGAGFVVERTYGDLAQAFTSVYNADPSLLEWHVYTEGWGGSFSKYDDSSLARYYAPWGGNMPGSGNPEFWNYEHVELDSITHAIYEGEYTDAENRTHMVQRAVVLGLQESVRLFLASQSDTLVAADDVNGIINHVASGISHSLTLTNAQTPSDSLRVGVKHLTQSSWNPVAGFSDVYSGDVASPLGTPSAVSHPHSGDIIPHAVQRQAFTAGPDGTLEVPPDAVRWDVHEQQWMEVGENATAITMVTLNYTFGNWHHGQATDINDILYQIYFITEWGTYTGDDDVTWDAEFTDPEIPALEDLVGIRHIDDDTMEVYINYWVFDTDDLASAGVHWTGTPWEIYYAMERIVLDGRAEFSGSAAVAHNVPWLSLIDTNDAALVREYLASFLEDAAVPVSLAGMDTRYYEDRYQAAISWIDEHNHAYVDNGPFMLASIDNEAGTATLSAFRDESYPYSKGLWSDFGSATFPHVVGISAGVLVADEEYSFRVFTANADRLQYFLSYETGGLVATAEINATGSDTITIPSETTTDVDACSLVLRVFAVSDTVIIPDSSMADVVVADCGVSFEERLEELGVADDMEFLRTLAGVVEVAQGDSGSSVYAVERIVDEQELSGVAIVLLTMILSGEISGDDLFEYIRP